MLGAHLEKVHGTHRDFRRTHASPSGVSGRSSRPTPTGGGRIARRLHSRRRRQRVLLGRRFSRRSGHRERRASPIACGRRAAGHDVGRGRKSFVFADGGGDGMVLGLEQQRTGRTCCRAADNRRAATHRIATRGSSVGVGDPSLVRIAARRLGLVLGGGHGSCGRGLRCASLGATSSCRPARSCDRHWLRKRPLLCTAGGRSALVLGARGLFLHGLDRRGARPDAHSHQCCTGRLGTGGSRHMRSHPTCRTHLLGGQPCVQSRVLHVPRPVSHDVAGEHRPLAAFATVWPLRDRRRWYRVLLGRRKLRRWHRSLVSYHS